MLHRWLPCCTFLPDHHPQHPWEKIGSERLTRSEILFICGSQTSNAGLQIASPPLVYLMAFGPEVLASLFIPLAREHLNVKEIVEGLLSEKPCTRNLVCMYYTLNMDLSLNVKIRTCIAAVPYPREHPRWVGSLHLPRTFLSALFALTGVAQEWKILPICKAPQGKAWPMGNMKQGCLHNSVDFYS